jgi:hypothetical protein
VVAHRSLHQCVAKLPTELIEIDEALPSLVGRLRISLAKKRLDHLIE